jgi:uncharacterized protein YjiS (DUF1127 family)
MMTTTHALAPIVHALAGAAGRVVTIASRRHSERLMARLSTHQLEDMGFARDWDGSIYRPADRF